MRGRSRSTSPMNHVASLASRALRFAESCLPIPLLYLALWPFAAVMAARELAGLGGTGSSFRQLRRLPARLRPGAPDWRWCRRVWSGRVAMCMTRFLRFWPDRLRDGRWSSRCRIEGLECLDAALGSGRPVIFVTLHFGNLLELYHWLRSRGVVVAFLVSRDLGRMPAYRGELYARADLANGIEGLPRFFQTEQLWEVRDFLGAAGKCLGTPMDTLNARHLAASGPGYALRMATGILRLAVIVDAVVVPCLISSPGGLRSTISFAEPVPEEDLASRGRHAHACASIVRAFDPWIASHPEQCGPALLQANHAVEEVAR